MPPPYVDHHFPDATAVEVTTAFPATPLKPRSIGASFAAGSSPSAQIPVVSHRSRRLSTDLEAALPEAAAPPAATTTAVVLALPLGHSPAASPATVYAAAASPIVRPLLPHHQHHLPQQQPQPQAAPAVSVVVVDPGAAASAAATTTTEPRSVSPASMHDILQDYPDIDSTLAAWKKTDSPPFPPVLPLAGTAPSPFSLATLAEKETHTVAETFARVRASAAAAAVAEPLAVMPESLSVYTSSTSTAPATLPWFRRPMRRLHRRLAVACLLLFVAGLTCHVLKIDRYLFESDHDRSIRLKLVGGTEAGHQRMLWE
ncbi:hypothetical protein HK405_006966 [Cladochytrium tenue]|nr:hypothetical protein HK405_006966 [Cladochytrium tenue]